jgi:multisubunit Na+/H+ antiporter MnhE subunit
MIDFEAQHIVRRLYLMTAIFGVIGFVLYLAIQGILSAAGFAIGALSSFGNLWLFERLSHSIATGDRPRKSWQAGTFIVRYVILFFIAYASIKTLGVNPLAVILGLLASTAAVLTSALFELFRSLLRS